MKKKLLSVALVVAMLAIVVSGTLAYFTAEDKVTNIFTIGSVMIEIYENGTATTEDVRNLGSLTPVVNMDDPSADESYIPKVINVKSTGLNKAYIRTFIAIPTALEGYLVLVMAGTDWTQVYTKTFTDETGMGYTVYAYDYAKAVKPGESTTDLLKGVYLNSAVDLKDNPATTAEDLEFCIRNADGTYSFSGYVAHSKTENGYSSNTVNVLVASQAIQAEGFTTEDATQALNTGFGEKTIPWATK